MKSMWLFLLLAATLLSLSGCPLPIPALPSPDSTGFTLPADSVNDTPRTASAGFSYQTLLPVAVKIGADLYEAGPRVGRGIAARRLPADT